MRVQVVDPPAYTPPYDRSLCAALARAGADVELVTSPFAHGAVAAGARATGSASASIARASRGGLDARRRAGPARRSSTCSTCCAFAAARPTADVTHYQWMGVPGARLAPAAPPPPSGAHRTRTAAHEDAPGKVGWGLRRTFARMDAVIALSEHGAGILRDRVGLPAERVRVIPHGALDYLTELPDEAPLPPELGAVEGPVVLFFGLIRPYKGVDVLLRAFRGGRGRGAVGRRSPVRGRSARAARARARPVTGESGSCRGSSTTARSPHSFAARRSSCLPYRHAEQSGVLYTAIAFGKAIVVTDVGGFPEVADEGAGEAGAARRSGGARRRPDRACSSDPAERRRLEAGARAARRGPLFVGFDRPAAPGSLP